MASEQSGDRLSLKSLWRRSKSKRQSKETPDEQQHHQYQQQQQHQPQNDFSPTGNLSSQLSDSASPEDVAQTASSTSPKTAKPALTPKEKAQARRAQVRRAQIQHRQRKANHVKQLELDVSQLRGMIAAAEREATAYRIENLAIRQVLHQLGLGENPGQVSTNAASWQAPAFYSGEKSPPPNWPLPPQQPPRNEPVSEELFGDVNVDDLVVTLGYSDVMRTPCFQISSSSESNSSGPASVVSAGSPFPSQGPCQLSTQQEQAVINFILSLEHVCWEHFSVGDFHCHEEHQISDEERGHTLMASAYCMASAPDSVYSDRKAFNTRKGRSSPPQLQWGASNISVKDLYGLAMSLNPGDEEIAPVQAWFELAARYSLEKLLQPGVLELLQREFRGVVKCVYFGAAIERLAFENIVERTLGSPTIQPSGPFGSGYIASHQ